MEQWALSARIRRFRESLGAATAGVSLKDWSEIAKNVSQIIAFVVAAVWTYQMFVQKEAPSLQRHATTGGNFVWSPIRNGRCEGSYYVSLKNDGLTDFDIREVRLRLWQFDSPSGTSGFAYVDRTAVQGQKPLFDAEFRDGAFVRHFPPGHERSERYAWFFNAEPERNVLVTIDFFTDASAAEPEWSQYYWWAICPTVSSLPAP